MMHHLLEIFLFLVWIAFGIVGCYTLFQMIGQGFLIVAGFGLVIIVFMDALYELIIWILE